MIDDTYVSLQAWIESVAFVVGGSPSAATRPTNLPTGPCSVCVDGLMDEYYLCMQCDGSGDWLGSQCRLCRGSGRSDRVKGRRSCPFCLGAGKTFRGVQIIEIRYRGGGSRPHTAHLLWADGYPAELLRSTESEDVLADLADGAPF